MSPKEGSALTGVGEALGPEAEALIPLINKVIATSAEPGGTLTVPAAPREAGKFIGKPIDPPQEISKK